MTCPNPHCRHKTKRKLRPLVISLILDNQNDDSPPTGTSRHERITQMFTTHPSLAAHFEPPVFSPGVPSREIRNRLKLLQYSRRAGLIRDIEWDMIVRAVQEQTAAGTGDALNDGMETLNIDSDFIGDVKQNQHEVIDPFLHLAVTTEVEDDKESEDRTAENKLKKKRWPQTITKSLIHISDERKGSAEDIAVPYSLELWRKAKSLSRDRSVLACTLAHLIAMKTLVGDNGCEQFDFILEDNVRAFVGMGFANDRSEISDSSWTGWSCECANRIWDIIELSNQSADDSTTCHLRYFGWLGSLPNLSWVYQKHIPRKGKGTDDMRIFPFPTNEDFELDSIPTDKESVKSQKRADATAKQDSSAPHFTTPGGTAVFGAFSYSVSAHAYNSLIYALQNDCGALLWKSKKMRAYRAKAVDKILPRHVRSTFGEKCVHVPDKVAFVRCPMLGSLLHQQWERGFCESTELQYKLSCIESTAGAAMQSNNLVWESVWLTDAERQIVKHRQKTGKWMSKDEMAASLNMSVIN